MKILAIVGTTRKEGDSYHVIREIEAAMNRIEPAEFEYLYLSDYELGFCFGCCACIFKGEASCPKREITAKIETALLKVDGIILAAPVYAHQVTALMKNFIDHFCYFFHRPRFFDKPAIILSTTGGSGLHDTLKYLRFTAIGWGFYVIKSIGIISSAFKASGVYREKKLQEINRTAVRLHQYFKKRQRPAPTLFELMFFRSMRFKAKYNPCDRQYWEERHWFNKGYFMDCHINPLKLLVANILEAMIGLAFHKKLKKD